MTAQPTCSSCMQSGFLLNSSSCGKHSDFKKLLLGYIALFKYFHWLHISLKLTSEFLTVPSQILHHLVHTCMRNLILFYSVYSVYTVLVVTLAVPLQIKLFFYFCACLVPFYPLGSCFFIPFILVSILALTFSFIIVLFTNYNHKIDCLLICHLFPTPFLQTPI